MVQTVAVSSSSRPKLLPLVAPYQLMAVMVLPPLIVAALVLVLVAPLKFKVVPSHLVLVSSLLMVALAAMIAMMVVTVAMVTSLPTMLTASVVLPVLAVPNLNLTTIPMASTSPMKSPLPMPSPINSFVGPSPLLLTTTSSSKPVVAVLLTLLMVPGKNGYQLLMVLIPLVSKMLTPTLTGLVLMPLWLMVMSLVILTTLKMRMNLLLAISPRLPPQPTVVTLKLPSVPKISLTMTSSLSGSELVRLVMSLNLVLVNQPLPNKKKPSPLIPPTPGKRFTGTSLISLLPASMALPKFALPT